MDIRQLRAFLTVYETRNISSAATRLHLSQPTLSVTIRQLEEQLGAPLFLRQARGVGISEEARQLYPRARRLVAEAEALNDLFRHGHGDCQQLTLGIEGEPGPAQIETVLKLAARDNPLLQLTLKAGGHGEARLAPEYLRRADELFLPLWEEPHVLAMRNDHPLAGRAVLTQEDLRQVEWIACPQHPAHAQLMHWYAPDGAVPCFAAQADSFSLALALVASGVGLALLPQSVAAGRAELTLRSLPQAAPLRRIGLCYNETARTNPALAALIERLARHVQARAG